jgi:hypothetical protein
MFEQEQHPPEAPTGHSARLEPESPARYLASLYRAAYGLCGSRQDSEDLVQNTYEKVLRRPRFLRRDTDLAYLLWVLRNTWVSSKPSPRPAGIPAEYHVDDIVTLASRRSSATQGAQIAAERCTVVRGALGRSGSPIALSCSKPPAQMGRLNIERGRGI